MSSSAAVISPLRLLVLAAVPPNIVSLEKQPRIAPLLTALTSTAPSTEQISAGFAGYTTHTPLQLRTKYYNASIGIWCDEVGDEWRGIMGDAAEEAMEVRRAVGGIVFVLSVKDVGEKEDLMKALNLLEQVEEVRTMCEDEGEGREIVGVVVVMGPGAEGKADAVEEELRGERGVFGWDVIAWEGDVLEGEGLVEKNGYGEKVGIERVKQILEAVPWTTSADDDAEGFLESEDDADWTTSEQRELDREMMGLKMDLHGGEDEDDAKDESFGEDEWPELQGGGEDIKVEQLQGLMERLIATREAASALSGPEKQKFAKREVERIMKQMG
jgi:hypothetical protein